MSKYIPVKNMFDDIIDSRELVSRLEVLTDERETLFDAMKEAKGKAKKAAVIEFNEWVDDYEEEWEDLKAINEEGESLTSEWIHGETLIREDYFTQYVQEMLEDCGDIPSDLPHYIVIDWEATADNLKQDYTEIDIFGDTYYLRAN